MPLSGVRVVEISSFVAVPLAGMTLAQLGAEVIRVDPVGGAADYRRWPLAEDGTSIYWTGLNKGKRSVAVDMRSPDGQQLVARLIADCGILITNVVGRQWHSYDELIAMRSDLIHLEVSGRGDGGTGVDYTVNAGLGFPLVTGPAGQAGPVNHVLPAWDVACGLYAALAITAALRQRDATGVGAHIRLPLEDVALATAGNLGFLTEPMVNGTQRERLGNAIYGQYGQTFVSADGVAFMVVALTGRHFRDLTELTGTTRRWPRWPERWTSTSPTRGSDSGTAKRCPGCSACGSPNTTRSRSPPGWRRRRSCGSATARSPRRPPTRRSRPIRCSRRCISPAWGSYLAPGLPFSIDGVRIPAVAAPALGDDTAAVLVERLGTSTEELGRLRESGTVTTGSRDSYDRAARPAGATEGAGDTFVAPGYGPGGKRAFGGQFVAQSMAAAVRTVDEPKVPTNIHLQFLRGGEGGAEVDYDVERTYDGRTAAARRVLSRQDGRVITAATVSFAAPLSGPEHGRYGDLPDDPTCSTPPVRPGRRRGCRSTRSTSGSPTPARARRSCADCGGAQPLPCPMIRWCTRVWRCSSPTST